MFLGFFLEGGGGSVCNGKQLSVSDTVKWMVSY